MAKVLSTVPLTAPASSFQIAVDATFTMSEYYTLSGGGGAPTVILYWQFDQGSGTWVDIPTSGSVGLVSDGGSQENAVVDTTYSHTITCKSAGTYVVRAKGVASTPKTVYSVNQPSVVVVVPPIAPTNAHTISKNTNQIVMGWTDNSSDETGFKVYKNSGLLETIAADSTSYTFAGLEPGVSYNLAVVATRSGIDSAAAQLTESTNPEVGVTLYEKQELYGTNLLVAWEKSPAFQTFTPAIEHNIYKVKLKMRIQHMYSGYTQVSIWSTGSDEYPLVKLCEAPAILTTSIPAVPTDITWYFSTNPVLSASTRYAIVVTTDGGDGSIAWVAVSCKDDASIDPYTGGAPGVYMYGGYSDYSDCVFYELDEYDTVFENQPAADNNYIMVVKGSMLDYGDWAWQTFTPQVAHNIKKVQVTVSRSCNIGTYTVAIYPTSGGKPTGEALALVTGNVLDIPSAKTLVTFTFPVAAALSASTVYAIVFTTLGADYSIYVYLKHDTLVDPYIRGKADNAGWIDYSNYYDWYFYEWGIILETVPAAPTGLVVTSKTDDEIRVSWDAVT